MEVLELVANWNHTLSYVNDFVVVSKFINIVVYNNARLFAWLLEHSE